MAPRLSSRVPPALIAQRRTSARLFDATSDADAWEGSARYALMSSTVKEPTAGGGRSS
jgi:hypothetical protein